MAIEMLMRLHPSRSGLVPDNPLEAGALEELPSAGTFKVSITQSRSHLFHRKGMALFRYLFNLWEPADATVDGVPVKKDFDSFRAHLTIQAGFFIQVFRPEGGFELKAKSLAWASMENVEFERVYSAVINVGLAMLPNARHLSEEEVSQAVDDILRFAA